MRHLAWTSRTQSHEVPHNAWWLTCLGKWAPYQQHNQRADICGLAALGAGFACSTGEGRFLTLGGGVGETQIAGLAFDNHLVRI